mmetsp:Transcript_12799/g.18647  ORF Transcript_12799/g.18647 Transcript_12799/m.18647 type:complete len:263 (-) Transcript_12799:155-943(-)
MAESMCRTLMLLVGSACILRQVDAVGAGMAVHQSGMCSNRCGMYFFVLLCTCNSYRCSMYSIFQLLFVLPSCLRSLPFCLHRIRSRGCSHHQYTSSSRNQSNSRLLLYMLLSCLHSLLFCLHDIRPSCLHNIRNRDCSRSRNHIFCWIHIHPFCHHIHPSCLLFCHPSCLPSYFHTSRSLLSYLRILPSYLRSLPSYLHSRSRGHCRRHILESPHSHGRHILGNQDGSMHRPSFLHSRRGMVAAGDKDFFWPLMLRSWSSWL